MVSRSLLVARDFGLSARPRGHFNFCQKTGVFGWTSLGSPDGELGHSTASEVGDVHVRSGHSMVRSGNQQPCARTVTVVWSIAHCKVGESEGQWIGKHSAGHGSKRRR